MTDHTNTTKLFDIPKPVEEVVLEFLKHGHALFLVGGYVRDLLMARDSNDVDATTSCEPEEIKAILRELDIDALYDVGQKYGTIACKYKGYDFEVTTYRTEQYTDGSRKPHVQFGRTLWEDLSRRDFTMNAIAYSLVLDQLVDPHGGIGDLERGMICAVDSPTDRFREDPLRMLRAIRFACQFNFAIAEDVYNAMFRHSSEILRISKERVRDELDKMLLSPYPEHAIRVMHSCGLLAHIMPEVDVLAAIPQRGEYHKYNVFEHTLSVLTHSPANITVRLCALLHDTGKGVTHKTISKPLEGNVDPCLRDTFYGHEKESAKIAKSVLRRLRYPTETVETVGKLCDMHMRPMMLYNDWPPSRKAIRRLVHDAGDDLQALFALNSADILGKGTDVTDEELRMSYDLMKSCADEYFNTDVVVAESPLDGNELMYYFFGFPGPGVGAAKEKLKNAVVDGIIGEGDKDAALDLLQREGYKRIDTI